MRSQQTLMKRGGGRQRDYSPELAELARLLALESHPRMADFGYAEVWVSEDGVPIAELARPPAEQEEIRLLWREEVGAGGDDEVAEDRGEEAEGESDEQEAETVDLDGRELAADVYVPFAALPAIEQAHYLLVSLLASHPPLNEAFNRLDEWVRLQDRDRGSILTCAPMRTYGEVIRPDCNRGRPQSQPQGGLRASPFLRREGNAYGAIPWASA